VGGLVEGEDFLKSRNRS